MFNSGVQTSAYKTKLASSYCQILLWIYSAMDCGSATLWQFYDNIRRQPRLVDPWHFDNVLTSIYHQLEDRHIKDWHQFVNYTWHPYCLPHHSPVCLTSLILHTVQWTTDQVLNISHKLSNKISHHSLLTHSEFLRMNLWQLLAPTILVGFPKRLCLESFATV